MPVTLVWIALVWLGTLTMTVGQQSYLQRQQERAALAAEHRR